MSKVFNPKVWYLIGIGAAALAFDGTRRLLKKRREDTERTEAEIATWPTSSTVAAAPPAAAAKAEASISTPPIPSAAKVAQSGKTSTTTKAPSLAQSKDDLTQIKGIGPVFAKRLAEAGITTFSALAAATPERLAEVTQATAVADPNDWIAQASLNV